MTNERCPYSIDHMQAHIDSVLLPEPRGIAKANNSPRSTDASILAIAVRWSADHASRNDSAPYVSQNERNDSRQASRRLASLTGGMLPMSLPAALALRFRSPVRDLMSAYRAAALAVEDFMRKPPEWLG